MLRAAFVDNYSPRKGEKQTMRGRPSDLLVPKKGVLILLRHGESRSIQMLQTRGCGLRALMSLEARSAFLLPIDRLSRGIICDGRWWLRAESLHPAAVECGGINFYSLITRQAVRIHERGTRREIMASTGD